MSILIKGITLDEFTSLDGNIGDFVNDEQLDVIEVPEPHGSLIDKTKLLDEKHIVPVTDEIGYIYTKDIINAPTVIEAEGEEK